MDCKIFLDTNIVVDYLIPDRKEHKSAEELFTKIYKMQASGYFSESVINTAVYLVRKDIATNTLKIIMNDLVSFIHLLPCTNTIVESAYKNAKNDLEDAVLYQLALNGKMDYFITSDAKDFKKIAHSSLPVVSTKKILEILNS